MYSGWSIRQAFWRIHEKESASNKDCEHIYGQGYLKLCIVFLCQKIVIEMWGHNDDLSKGLNNHSDHRR